MKISLKWLSEFVKIDYSLAELADMLTMAGLEVEGTQSVGSELEGVVVGKIVSIAPHREAERLFLCRVDIGSDVVSIVCGATNIQMSDHVPVALPGSILPNGTRIEKAEIRGECSAGMMCSEWELGLGEEAGGIMLLPRTTRPGEPVRSALGLEDQVLDISVTPNRGDCLSVLGIAREISALLQCSIRLPETRVREGRVKTEELTSVQILDQDLCGRYAARLLQSVRIGASPLWMRWRLKSVGIRPINNVVDATNYVMVEMGQPLHAFDFECLQGKRIVVRRAREGEMLVTLDGVERVLSSEMLVIADIEKPVAVAGIMGGSTSEVSPQTDTVLLESAWFHPLSIRRTSKSLGMQTEASYRFERRVDPEGCVWALNRAAQLIQEMSGAESSAGVIDVYPQCHYPAVVRLRPHRVNRILGTRMPKTHMVRILKRLHLTPASLERGEIAVTVPSFRGDISREIDLIEEIARVYGFAKIPSTFPRGEIHPGPRPVSLAVESQLRRLMSSCGFYEVVNFSFTSPEVFDKFRLPAGDMLREAVRLRNPLREDACLLRTFILPSLLENLSWNGRRNIRSMKIFEIAKTFHPSGSAALPREQREMAAVAMGYWFNPHWDGQKEEADFFFIKGVVETVGKILGLQLEWETANYPFLHPGRAARLLVQGQGVGWMGQVHPEVVERYDLGSPVFGFSLFDLDLISSLCSRARQCSPLPRFPAVVRDVSLLVPVNLPYAVAHDAIRRAGGGLVEEVRLFDVYQGERISPGYKSLGFTIQYRAKDRTLTDEEVNRVHLSLLDSLKRDLGAEIR